MYIHTNGDGSCCCGGGCGYGVDGNCCGGYGGGYGSGCGCGGYCCGSYCSMVSLSLGLHLELGFTVNKNDETGYF